MRNILRLRENLTATNINFPDHGMSREGCLCVCGSVLLIDSIFNIGANYYPQVFLDKWKSIVKGKKMSMFINDELATSLDNCDYSDDSDEEAYGEKI